MAIRAVLFDLDGTLLPMDQDTFVKAYFGGLAKKLTPYGYEAQKLFDSLWKGVAAMVKNDGSRLNEALFWEAFTALCGEHTREDEPIFAEFYQNEFSQVQQVCGFAPQAAPLVRRLREGGYTTVLATNPIFPAIATESRMRWAGLQPTDFELYTTYENTGFCKPNPAYYLDIAARIGCAPEECLMVGNDVGEDMVARTVGMQVFLLTDCLINKQDADITAYPHGDFDALEAFLQEKGLI